MSYGDYVEQLTFLLFLKMTDEQASAPFNGFGRDVLPKLKTDVTANLQRATRLRESILERAFSGSL